MADEEQHPQTTDELKDGRYNVQKFYALLFLIRQFGQMCGFSVSIICVIMDSTEPWLVVILTFCSIAVLIPCIGEWNGRTRVL